MLLVGQREPLAMFGFCGCFFLNLEFFITPFGLMMALSLKILVSKVAMK